MLRQSAVKNDSHEKPKRRWFQFSLRTLLIVVTVSAASLGWVGWKLEQGRRERAAIAWVEEMSGSVGFDFQEEKGWWKEWTGKWFGGSVRKVYLNDRPVSNLSPLARLKGLKWLDLTSTQASAEQVQKLQQALPDCGIHHSTRDEE